MRSTSSAYRALSRKRNMHTAHWVEQALLRIAMHATCPHMQVDTDMHAPPHSCIRTAVCMTFPRPVHCMQSRITQEHVFWILWITPANRENDEHCTHDCCTGQTVGPTQRHSRPRHVVHGCAAVHRAKFQICAGIMPICMTVDICESQGQHGGAFGLGGSDPGDG